MLHLTLQNKPDSFASTKTFFAKPLRVGNLMLPRSFGQVKEVSSSQKTGGYPKRIGPRNPGLGVFGGFVEASREGVLKDCVARGVY